MLSEHIKPEMLWAYPYNALRNHAIARAHTEVGHSLVPWHPIPARCITANWPQIAPARLGPEHLPDVQVLLLADVDFLVTAGLHERLSEGAANQALVEDTTLHRHVVVLPAFETDPQMGLQAGSDAAARAIPSAVDPVITYTF